MKTSGVIANREQFTDYCTGDRIHAEKFLPPGSLREFFYPYAGLLSSYCNQSLHLFDDSGFPAMRLTRKGEATLRKERSCC